MKRFGFRLILLPALAAGLAASQAHAQILPGRGLAPKGQSPSSGPPARPPPPALPGAGVEKEMVAPPEHAPSDLQPNEALFDAINRGDSASARDALNRGADL